jgi:hypothetical protein
MTAYVLIIHLMLAGDPYAVNIHFTESDYLNLTRCAYYSRVMSQHQQRIGTDIVYIGCQMSGVVI